MTAKEAKKQTIQKLLSVTLPRILKEVDTASVAGQFSCILRHYDPNTLEGNFLEKELIRLGYTIAPVGTDQALITWHGATLDDLVVTEEAPITTGKDEAIRDSYTGSL